MSKAVSVRLDKDLLDELDGLAAALDRSRTFLITEAVRAYLSEYGDYRIALDRLLDKDDAILSASELRGRLGI
jgi:predicted transcriptional regulator